MDNGSILTAYGGAVALLIGITSTAAISFAVYWFTKPTKLIAAAIWTENMVRQLSSWVSDLVVTYQGRPVTAASVSRVVIWNNGRKELTRSDIAPAAPVRISARSPAQILAVSPLKPSSDANRATVSPVDPTGFAQIDFDYLNPRDALAVQVIHTGTSNADLRVSGQVIGGPSLRMTDPWRGWINTLLSIALLVAFVAMLVATNEPGKSWATWVYIGVFLALLAGVVAANRLPARLTLKPHLSMAPYVRPRR